MFLGALEVMGPQWLTNVRSDVGQVEDLFECSAAMWVRELMSGN
jgi:hypothetical protein